MNLVSNNRLNLVIEKEISAKIRNLLKVLKQYHLIMEVQVKIRYGARPAEATIYMKKGMVRVEFAEPQRAITPGQSVVYYLDDYVLGGGLIC